MRNAWLIGAALAISGCSREPSVPAKEVPSPAAAQSPAPGGERPAAQPVAVEDPAVRGIRTRLDAIPPLRWTEEAPYRLVGDAYGEYGPITVRHLNRVGPRHAGALKRLADLGHVRAQELVGLAYAYGHYGFPGDKALAWDYYRRAIAGGSRDAPGRAARLFIYRSIGLRNDVAQAARLWQIGAERGNPYAMVQLADLYFHGCAGLEANPARAVELYRRASSMGNSGADLQLGLLHLHGRAGVRQDDAEALRLLLRHDGSESSIGIIDYEDVMRARRTGGTPREPFWPPAWCHSGA